MIDESWYRRPEGTPEHVAAGGVVVRIENGRPLVALVNEAGRDGYVLPKGHVEDGEDLVDTARREIAEESGLTNLRVIDELGVRERLNFTRTSWKTTHYYLFVTEQVNGASQDPKHTRGVRWFPLDALPPLFWPEQADLIRSHRQQIAEVAERAQSTLSPEERGVSGGPAAGRNADIRKTALRFVLVIGILSFFADFTYEGARSILGPYLASLQASAAVVGIVAGLGELLGYGLRLVSGRLADRTQKFWPITILGYVLQMSAVPLLALAGNWQMAAVLIILERVGKATRNPPRDVMLSHAGKQIGYGWVFGVHESLDQFGALFGPLAVAGVLALRGDYRLAFAALAIPAAINLALVATAHWLYPHPENMEATPPNMQAKGLPRTFWMYLAGAALVAAGFADFPIIAYHFAQASVVRADLIPVFYAVAMGVSGTGSLAFGRLFDRFGFSVLIVLTLVAALFAPLVFLGGFWAALVGMALWGLGMGVHESIIPAAVAPMVSPEHRASAYGLFTAGYGIFWFFGSAMIGILYGVSIPAVIAFSVVLQLAAVPWLLLVARRTHHAR